LVLHRHIPAGEIDHFGAQFDVLLSEGRTLRF